MTNYELDLSKYGPLAKGTADSELRKAASKALRNGMAILQRHHKQVEIRRGGGKRSAVAGRVTRRTGEHSRSFGVKMQPKALSAVYGSDNKKAALLEFGGTIRPKKAKSLAIPTENAMQGVGQGLGPRAYPDLFKPKGKNYLAMQKGGRLVVMFHLVKSARIPARPGLANTLQKKTPEVIELIARACGEAI